MSENIDLSKLSKAEIEDLKYNQDEDKEYSEKELKELRKKHENGEKLTKSEAQALHEEDKKQQIKDIDYIIHGTNDTFVKDYNFIDDDKKLRIEIKAPNIVEEGKINGLREQYLAGTGQAQNTFYYNAYDGLAVIRVCGKNVPKEIRSDEQLYATDAVLDWLATIDTDFYNWLSRFQA